MLSESEITRKANTPGGTKWYRDQETRDIVDVHTENLATLGGKVTSLEELYKYLNTSNTWFGCKWPVGDGNPEGTPVGNLLRLAHMQQIFRIGGYMVKNDHSRKKLHTADHRHYEDGGAVDFTGGDGHYQWGWGVGMYYASWSDESYDYEAFDDRPIPGVPCVYIPVGSRSCAGFAALDRTNNILCSYINKTAQYRGGANNSAWDGTWRSQLGKPVSNIGMPTLATYARKNGNLWFTSERVMLFITGALARVYFHNRNIQAAYNATLTSDGLHQGGLGAGISQDAEWGDRGYAAYDLDIGIEKGDFTGLLSATITSSSGGSVAISNIPCFMGLKNFYKYLWTMTEDELLVCQADGSQAFYVEENITGAAFDVSGAGTHLLVGKTPVHASVSWSYIKKISTAYLSGMPVEDGGSGSTFFADGYYNPNVKEAGTVRGSLRLGNALNGDHAGSCVLRGNLAPSSASADGGAVLCEFAEPFSTKLSVLAAA
ncbi:MAG: hypothetical protein IJ868_00475 [Prevotella sp.]|nr:hypothetical protein [Prevotella sp.]